MDTEITPDPRNKDYEKKCHIVNGQGGVVRIDPGTRIYRESSCDPMFEAWLKDLIEIYQGQIIPFEWVTQYVGVTRAALHKKVAKGGLTVFVFETQELVKKALGGYRTRSKAEYKYALISECDQWKDKLSTAYQIFERNKKAIKELSDQDIDFK